MIRDKEKQEIIGLIQNGFELDLISFELDIPIKELEQLKEELDKKKKIKFTRTYNYEQIVDMRNKETHIKVEKMRERYRKLFYKSNETYTTLQEELSQEDIEIINSSIIVIQDIIEEMKSDNKELRRKKFKNILLKMKRIQNYQLTIEQAEQLNILFNTEEIQGLNISKVDKIDEYLNRCKQVIARKLAEAVNFAQYETEDLEELKALKNKLSFQVQQQNPMLVSSVKNRISSKITKINQQKAIERIKNNIPINILQIINDLASGTLDVNKAKEIIENEAKKKVSNGPNTKFALTEQQEKKQILTQIEISIRDRSNDINIVNPEATILQLHELSGENLEQSIGIVIENLISTKKFEEAKKICDRFSNKNKEGEFVKSMRYLRLKIRNEEISDIILKAINMKTTEEEEEKCFELIEKGIRLGNVKLKAISLGKNQDGTRSITLDDIWSDKKQKERL